MPTITLKNIPADLYDRLKRQAAANRRSLNSEMLHCLETVLKPKRVTAEERLARVRRLRPAIDPLAVSDDELIEAIDAGRP